MAYDLNPFAGLIETKAYPHARAFRHSLKLKLLDTIRIFWGYFTYQAGKNSRPGMFDYLLILGLLPLLAKAQELAARRYGDQSKLALGLGYTLSAWQIITLIPRFIFTVAMVSVCLIPVCLVHAYTSLYKGNKLKNEINNLTPDNLDMTVGEQLEDFNTSLEEIRDLRVIQQPNSTECTLQFFAAATRPPHEAPEDIEDGSPEETQPLIQKNKLREVITFKLDTTEHPKFFQALKELNVGGIQSKQEAEDMRGRWYDSP